MEGEILERELAFHREVAKQSLSQLRRVPDYIVDRYATCRNWQVFPKERIFREIRLSAEKSGRELTIGEFGCGDGTTACELALAISDIRLESFDISPELIEVAKKRAQINGVEPRTHFFVADAEREPMSGRQMDIMLALNILHHVDIANTVPALVTATKPGGMLVFNEPIAFSSWLQRLRDRVPVKKNVSPDERQLSRDEIEYLVSLLDRPIVQYYWMIQRLARIIPHANEIDKGHPIAKATIILMGWLDRILLTVFPFLKKFAGRALIFGYRAVA